MTDDRKLLIIIPAFNEQESLKRTVLEAKSVIGADVIVVNDGSADQTEKIARENGAKVITLPFNLGIGAAVQTGLRFALSAGYDFAVQVDADGQHDVTSIPQLLQVLDDRHADIAIGSRRLAAGSSNAPLIRRLGLTYFSLLTTLLTGQHITDCASGLRALNTKAIELFAENYPVDYPDAEALILAHKAGLKIVEIASPFRQREYGQSKLNLFKLLYYPIKETLSMIKTVWERRRVRQY